MENIFTAISRSHDQLYQEVYRDQARKDFCNRLWERFKPQADLEWMIEIKSQFHQRFWEMYLTCSLQDIYLSLFAPKPGPDCSIECEGKTVKIEAVTVSNGTGANQVFPTEPGHVFTIPDEKIVLRYRTSFDAKWKQQQEHIAKGYISNSDCYVIAMNAATLTYAWADPEIPRIVKVLYGIGNLQFDLAQKKLEHAFRPFVWNANNTAIDVFPFLDNVYKSVSAVIHSRATAGMHSMPLGDDFMIIHNPYAENPLPPSFMPSSTHYRAAVRPVSPIENELVIDSPTSRIRGSH